MVSLAVQPSVKHARSQDIKLKESPPTLKKLLPPLVITAAGVFAISVLVVAKPKPTPRPPDAEPAHIKVTVAEIKREAVRLSVHTQGTVKPKREIDLIAQVSGQVLSAEPEFVAGGFFSAAEVLMRIDDRPYQAALLAARARLAEAQQKLAEEQGMGRGAQREWRDLGSANANELFLRKPQMAAVLAGVESAKAALAMAELDLEHTGIRGPFQGRVRQTHVNLGQYVTAGTRLATVYDAAVAEVRLPLTEAQAALIDLPLSADRRNPPTPVTLKATVAGAAHEWQGLLTRTDAFVDPTSRLYFAVVEVAEPFSQDKHLAPLLPGLFVEAEIEGKSLENVIMLPRSALFERNKVLVVGEDNKITEYPVRVLHKSEAQVWVQAPIDDMTLVSLEKQALTPAGTTVNPVLPTAKASTASIITPKD